MATTSKEINLAQLDNELGSKGLIANFEDKSKKIIMASENSDVTQAQVEAAIAAHTPKPVIEPTVAEKLASVGITIDDLKAALM